MPNTESATVETVEIARFQCRHIFTDGRRCASPALRKELFCYYHHTSRKPVPKQELDRRRSIQAGEPATETTHIPFHLPDPEDRSAIQHAIGQVLSRIATGEIDPRRAGLLLYGLQIASLNLPKPLPKQKPAPMVEEIAHDPHHGPIAPELQIADHDEQGPGSLYHTLMTNWAKDDAKYEAEKRRIAEANRIDSLQAAASSESHQSGCPRYGSLTAAPGVTLCRNPKSRPNSNPLKTLPKTGGESPYTRTSPAPSASSHIHLRHNPQRPPILRLGCSALD